MKNKTAVLLVVALVCGLGAAFLTARLIADRGKAPVEEKVDVLVAKSAVPQYKAIKEPEKYFVKKTVTKSEAPKGAITRLEDLKGKRLKVPLSQDKVVTQADLLDDKGTGAGMTGLVPEGFLAISIKVSPETGVAGFILPHTKVDVIASLKRNDAKSIAQVILQDVLVLAVGGRSDRDENTQSMTAHTVTLALSPEDAMKISLASDVSLLRLALRGEGDGTQRELKPVKVSDFLKGVPGEEDNPEMVASKGTGGVVGPLPLPPIESRPGEEFKKPEPVWTVTVREGDKVSRKDFYKDKNGAIVTTGEDKKIEPTPPATENKE